MYKLGSGLIIDTNQVINLRINLTINNTILGTKIPQLWLLQQETRFHGHSNGKYR